MRITLSLAHRSKLPRVETTFGWSGGKSVTAFDGTGWVLTVEPGLYRPEEGFAVRLENDVLVTVGKLVDLMADLPIEAEPIEELMNQRGKRRAAAVRRKSSR